MSDYNDINNEIQYPLFMKCPPIFSKDEIQTIIDDATPKLEGTRRQVENDLRKVIAIKAIRKVVGEQAYSLMMTGRIKTNSFLDYIYETDRYENLKFWVLINSLNLIHCRPGFREKLVDLLRGNQHATEFELRVASIFEMKDFPVNFAIPHYQQGPEFEIDYYGIAIGVECKWKPKIQYQSNARVAKTIINSLDKAKKKFRRYTTGFIIVGGNISGDKYQEFQKLIVPKIESWLKVHKRINIVFFYPIVETRIPEEKIVTSIMGSVPVVNENPNVILDMDKLEPLLSLERLEGTFENLPFRSPNITKKMLEQIIGEEVTEPDL
jgi:hypothetical protein